MFTYLAWLQPIYYDPKFVFKHVKNEKNFARGEEFNKKHKTPATLISNHKSKTKIIAPSKNTFHKTGALQNCSLKKNAF